MRMLRNRLSFPGMPMSLWMRSQLMMRFKLAMALDPRELRDMEGSRIDANEEQWYTRLGLRLMAVVYFACWNEIVYFAMHEHLERIPWLIISRTAAAAMIIMLL